MTEQTGAPTPGDPPVDGTHVGDVTSAGATGEPTTTPGPAPADVPDGPGGEDDPDAVPPTRT